MAHAYTPGLTVTPQTVHRSRRVLPLQGTVLVSMGQRVQARDSVAEAFMPGDVMPLNMANLLSLPPADVPDCMLKCEGDSVEIDEPLARTKGIFGLFKSEYRSKVQGTLESISGVTGQVIVRGPDQPLRVSAYLAGTVVEVLPREGVVVEARAALIQGIFGVGGEAHGPIRMHAARGALSAEMLLPEMKGCILVCAGRVTAPALARAVQVGVQAIVAGGIDDEDLKGFLGHDLGVAITGSERLGLTLVITEGFGDITMADRTWKLLTSRAGHEASVNGATQIRAGVLRPEVVIPLLEDAPLSAASSIGAGYLDLGVQVRIIRDPYFGLIGTVRELPPEPMVLASGSKARVLEVELERGERVIVPRANVELIQE